MGAVAALQCLIGQHRRCGRETKSGHMRSTSHSPPRHLPGRLPPQHNVATTRLSPPAARLHTCNARGIHQNLLPKRPRQHHGARNETSTWERRGHDRADHRPRSLLPKQKQTTGRQQLSKAAPTTNKHTARQPRGRGCTASAPTAKPVDNPRSNQPPQPGSSKCTAELEQRCFVLYRGAYKSAPAQGTV